MIKKTQSLDMGEMIFNMLLKDDKINSQVNGSINAFSTFEEAGLVLTIHKIRDKFISHKHIWILSRPSSFKPILVIIGKNDDLDRYNGFTATAKKNARCFSEDDFYGAVEYIKEVVLEG